MKSAVNHLKKNIFRGVLAIIPLALTFFVVRILYVGIDKRVMGWIDQFIGISIPGLGILITLTILYLVGIAASNMAGKQIFSWIEKLSNKIPLINTTYNIGKKLTTTLSLPEKQVFKKAVLVEFMTPGTWTIGFVTGVLLDKSTNEKLLKIYVPTPPNPTSGFIMILKESDVRDPGWSIEQTMEMVVSGGIIGPAEIK